MGIFKCALQRTNNREKMAKPDFPPLLQPGLHNITLPDLHALAVAPFEDQRRHDLYERLIAWVGALQGLGLAGTLWLDGSFMTQKPGPGDIDCVLWNPHWATGIPNADPAVLQQISHLLDHDAAENLFNLDLYVETPAQDQVFHREAYWRGVLGFSHDRVTAKGFAEVSI
jgi:hypothetical protein